jgi:hypothetical protein
MPLSVEMITFWTAALNLDLGRRLTDLEEAATRIVDDAIERDGVKGGGEDATLVKDTQEYVLGRRTDPLFRIAWTLFGQFLRSSLAESPLPATP